MDAPTYIADTKGDRRLEREGLTLLFHGRSGTTHVLAPPSPQLLDLLEQRDEGAAGLLARLRQDYVINDEGAQALVEARLAELEAAGLVRRS